MIADRTSRKTSHCPEKEQQQLKTYHQQQVQRADYEVGLARRRYDKVDPDNRLVAQELERDWEDKLRQLQVAREDLERRLHKFPEVQLSPALREQLSHLNRELPQLWSQSQLTNQHKKQLLRTLIDKVVLKRISPDQVQVKVIWVSGHFSEEVVYPPIWKQADTSQHQEMVARIQQLWQQGQTDAFIAKTLNQAEFRSARKLRITDAIVCKIRRQHQWFNTCNPSPETGLVDGLWTIKTLAANLGVKPQWIYNRIATGFLREPDLIPQPRGHYFIHNDSALIERLQQEVKRTQKFRNKVRSSH